MAYEGDDGSLVVVEYDGDEHYTNTLKIKVDHEKDFAAAGLGYRVVRFPFWVQLDTRTTRHFFGINADIPLRFPHGFITTRWFPASFCHLGMRRFEQELARLEESVRAEVLESIRDRIAEHGEEYVIPVTLRHLLTQ
ncbi:MAG: hypothetical protein ACKVW3_05340 [Phycisphaerales bacterium]